MLTKRIIPCLDVTGGRVVKGTKFLNLRDEDNVMGVLYLGYADQYPEGKRTIPLENKIKWVK